jgi:hypothetical protein
VTRRRLPAVPVSTHRPATPDELLVRAWQVFDEAGAMTADELAGAAGLTRGGALSFLTNWSKTGHATTGARPGGVQPYDVRFERTRPNGSERVA